MTLSEWDARVGQRFRELVKKNGGEVMIKQFGAPGQLTPTEAVELAYLHGMFDVLRQGADSGELKRVMTGQAIEMATTRALRAMGVRV